jgi:hypothetical protein
MLAASASGIATVNASAGIATPESLTSMPAPAVTSTPTSVGRSAGARS